MKKTIGYTALVVGIIDLFTLMFLMLSGNVFSDGGFSPMTSFCFVLWFVCVITVIFCLGGYFFQFLGKTIGGGFDAQLSVQSGNSKYCSQCGKVINNAPAFCPHCGAKQ